MKSLSKIIYKDYQVNLGMPFQVRIPLNEFVDGDFDAEKEIGDFFLEDAMENETDEEETEKINPVQAAEERAQEILKEAKSEYDKTLEDAAVQAQLILETAREEAEEHRKEVEKSFQDKCKKIEEETKKNAFNQGKAEGLAEYEQRIHDADEIKIQAKADYEELLKGAEADAVKMIMTVAKKVIGKELTDDPQNLLALIRDAFIHCSNKEQAILKVSANDFEYIHENKDKLLSMLEGVDSLEIKQDLSLPAGSCFVETSFGSIDAGIETRMRKIEDAFSRMIAVPRKERRMQ